MVGRLCCSLDVVHLVTSGKPVEKGPTIGASDYHVEVVSILSLISGLLSGNGGSPEGAFVVGHAWWVRAA